MDSPRRFFPADTPVLRCPTWPITLTLDAIGTQAMSVATAALAGINRPARRHDVVGIGIARCDDDAESLRALILGAPPLQATGRSMIRVPAPVSLRLNLLIHGIHRDLDFRCSRSGLVRALLIDLATQTPEDLGVSFDLYCGMRAGRLAPASYEEHEVLTRRRPKPGPRPLQSIADPKRHR